jgi:hypothetical protein
VESVTGNDLMALQLSLVESGKKQEGRLVGINRTLAASAILREAGRLADSRKKSGKENMNRISPDDIQWALEDFRKVLAEISKL